MGSFTDTDTAIDITALHHAPDHSPGRPPPTALARVRDARHHHGPHAHARHALGARPLPHVRCIRRIPASVVAPLLIALFFWSLRAPLTHGGLKWRFTYCDAAALSIEPLAKL